MRLRARRTITFTFHKMIKLNEFIVYIYSICGYIVGEHHKHRINIIIMSFMLLLFLDSAT